MLLKAAVTVPVEMLMVRLKGLFPVYIEMLRDFMATYVVTSGRQCEVVRPSTVALLTDSSIVEGWEVNPLPRVIGSVTV